MVHRIEELKRVIQERCPEYGELLAEGMAPADADRTLAEPVRSAKMTCWRSTAEF